MSRGSHPTEDDWEDDYLSYDEGPSHVIGFCQACGEPCTSVTQDYGIGAYECWGARGNDVQLVEVSPCCETEVLSDKPEEEENDDCQRTN